MPHFPMTPCAEAVAQVHGFGVVPLYSSVDIINLWTWAWMQMQIAAVLSAPGA